jgi:hypothetical protein
MKAIIYLLGDIYILGSLSMSSNHNIACWTPLQISL